MGKSGGRYARNRGNRGEYLVRDELRSAGFTVDRIPASGAAQGFKGDLRIKIDPSDSNKDQVVEVKLRKDEFTKLYDLLNEVAGLSISIQGIILTQDPFEAIYPDTVRARLAPRPNLIKLLEKCLRYRANSDILAIKMDRKPVLYLRWLSETEGTPGHA